MDHDSSAENSSGSSDSDFAEQQPAGAQHPELAAHAGEPMVRTC